MSESNIELKLSSYEIYFLINTLGVFTFNATDDVSSIFDVVQMEKISKKLIEALESSKKEHICLA